MSDTTNTNTSAVNTTGDNAYLATPDYGLETLATLVEHSFQTGILDAGENAQMREFLDSLAVRPTPIERPFTPAEAEAAADAQGTIRAVVEWDFDSLLGADIDDLNDGVSEAITGSIVGLTDITYRVTGTSPTGLTVYIEVTGNISDWLDEQNEHDDLNA